MAPHRVEVGFSGVVSLGSSPSPTNGRVFETSCHRRQRLCSVATSGEKPGDFLLLSPLPVPHGAPPPPLAGQVANVPVSLASSLCRLYLRESS